MADRMVIQRKYEEKERAKDLFVHTGLQLNEIGVRLNVTPKTVGKWAKENNWIKLRERFLADSQQKSINGLRLFLKDFAPALSTEIDKAILDYLLL